MVKKAKLGFMDTDSFIAEVRIKDIYKDITEDVEKKTGASNFDTDRPFPTGKDNRVIGLLKNELGGPIMKKRVGLWPKTYSYLKTIIIIIMIKVKKQKGQKSVP